MLLLGLPWSNLQADQPADSLLHLLDSLPENSDRLDLYLTLSKEMSDWAPDQARAWLDKMEQLAISLEDTTAMFWCLRERGMIAYYHGPLEQAKEIFSYLLAHPEFWADQKDQADILNLQGVAYEALGQSDSALVALKEANQVYRSLEDRSGQAKVMANMATSFYKLGNTQQSLEYLEKAYQLALEYDHTDNLPAILSNYAMLKLEATGDDQLVEALLRELKTYPVVQENPLLLATFCQNLATYLLKVGELDPAQKYFEQALAIKKTHQLKPEWGIPMGLGLVQQLKNRHVTAIPHFRQSLQATEKSMERRTIFKAMGESFLALGQPDSTQKYWGLYTQLVHQMEEELETDLVLKSKLSLDMVVKEYEIDLLHQQQTLDEARLRLDRLTIGGLLVLVLLLGWISWLMIRAEKRTKALQEAELTLKNQHLLNLSLQINQKNQILVDFEAKLQSHPEGAASQSVSRDLAMALKEVLRVDEDWKTFELYFQDLYSGFYHRVESQFPQLSAHELRIITLIKLRLTGREIAQLLNITQDAVKTARYRIRKKLELTPEVDLVVFLSEL
ncbi:tetratricopeptide repeat protein [Pontibacter sp. G13]|uniref:tetratricopeptide repeat protein n=1 Tax=Pontibacter sp. G13 TaxID=3074898 RepID=UPI00288B8387|nr:tetratricopeptide repeat protein [Pontibacter sp. G13]WNJ17690.1 tetratricopeptide repeat protein [Pontibacter sp. G13]